MALRVWLPLIRDINNQGISNLTFKNVNTANTTNVAGGKLGKCYQNNSNTAGGLVSNETISLGQNQSMFCWVKMNSFYSTASLTGIGGQHRYSSNRGMGITMRYASATTGYLSVNTGNGSSRTYNDYYGKTLLNAGTWYHVGYTYDGSTIRLYVNGKLDKEQAYSGMSVPADYICIFAWSLNSTSGNAIHANYQLNGMINDFRIYDHTLSQKEISELAKGMICHYRLDNHGCGCPNLCKPASAFNNGGNTSMVNDSVCITFNNSDTYFRIQLTEALVANIDYTLSCDITGMYENSGSWVFPLFAQANPISKVLPMKNGHVSVSFKLPAGNTYVGTTNIFMDDSGNRSVTANVTPVGAKIYLKNFKLEKSSVATPFYPNSIPNSTVESDCSGNGYNGNIKGTIAITEDTPRYNCCYDAKATGYVMTPVSAKDMTPVDTLTVACWIKWTAFNTSNPLGCWEGGGGGFDVSASSSDFALYINGAYRVTPTAQPPKFSLNTWYHLCGTYDGNDMKFYINGILVAQLNYPGVVTYNANAPWMIGGNPASQTSVDSICNAKYSDFRLYGTALSDADVLELAKTSASIDKTGKVYCYNYIEE